MKKIASFCVVLFAACVGTAHADSHVNSAVATLVNKTGKTIGQASLVQGPNGVLIHVAVKELTPGKHGLHIHSHGVCETETGFKSAKGHVGKLKGAHGLMNPKGPEPGDLPNIFIGADGTGEIEVFSSTISISGASNNLLDSDGSTFIIHENADDHISQPIGGAGVRVACGIIKSK